MRADLEELAISAADLRDWTGTDGASIDRDPVKSPVPVKLISIVGLATFMTSFICQAVFFVPTFRIPAIIFVGAALLGAGSVALELAEIAILILLAGVGAGIYAIYTLTAAAPANFIAINLLISIVIACISSLIFWWLQNGRSTQPRPQNALAKKLLSEVAKYNKVVNDIHVFDQLAAAGNPVSFNDRHGVIQALIIARRDLVRALKTERILRENPSFNPERFEIDLNAWQALQVGEQASEYGKLFDATMQIAIDVQRSMRQV